MDSIEDPEEGGSRAGGPDKNRRLGGGLPEPFQRAFVTGRGRRASKTASPFPAIKGFRVDASN